jgi:hypothetical protein
MKTGAAIAVVSLTALAALAIGFYAGFRQGWQLSGMTDAAPRAMVAMQLNERIDAGHVDEAKYYFDSQIDAGLMFWHDVSESPVSSYLNTLTGDKVFPEYEKYIRRLAEYRKANPSPLWDPAMIAEVDANIAKHDPELAKEMSETGQDAKKVMDEVIQQYAP